MLKHFYGTDAYRMREAVGDYLESSKDASLLRLDLTQDSDLEDLERELKYPSFFQDERILIASGALADAETAENVFGILKRYEPEKDKTITLILLGGAGSRSSAATKKLTEHLAKHAELISFDILKGPEQIKWINQFCGKRGLSIQPSAASSVINRVGAETWAIAMELEKLCSYSHGEINSADVAALTLVPTEQNEFEFTDSIYAHNKRGIISALWRRLADGTPEQLLLGTLASGIRTILTVKSGPSASRAAGVHPFTAQKAIQGASTYTEQQLLEAHGRLAKLDRDSKDGKADLVDGLMDVIFRL